MNNNYYKQFIQPLLFKGLEEYQKGNFENVISRSEKHINSFIENNDDIDDENIFTELCIYSIILGNSYFFLFKNLNENNLQNKRFYFEQSIFYFETVSEILENSIIICFNKELLERLFILKEVYKNLNFAYFHDSNTLPIIRIQKYFILSKRVFEISEKITKIQGFEVFIFSEYTIFQLVPIICLGFTIEIKNPFLRVLKASYSLTSLGFTLQVLSHISQQNSSINFFRLLKERLFFLSRFSYNFYFEFGTKMFLYRQNIEYFKYMISKILMFYKEQIKHIPSFIYSFFIMPSNLSEKSLSKRNIRDTVTQLNHILNSNLGGFLKGIIWRNISEFLIGYFHKFPEYDRLWLMEKLIIENINKINHSSEELEMYDSFGDYEFIYTELISIGLFSKEMSFFYNDDYFLQISLKSFGIIISEYESHQEKLKINNTLLELNINTKLFGTENFPYIGKVYYNMGLLLKHNAFPEIIKTFDEKDYEPDDEYDKYFKNFETKILGYYNYALNIFEKNNEKYNSACVELAICELWISIGKNESAIEKLNHLLIFFKFENYPKENLKIKFYIKIIEFSQKKEAKSSFFKAFKQCVSLSESYYDKLEYFNILAKLTSKNTYLFENYEKIFYIYKYCLSLIEKIRESILEPIYRENFTFVANVFYHNTIFVLSHLEQEINNKNENHLNKFYNRFFQYIEMAKTRTLIDNINGNQFIFNKGLFDNPSIKNLITKMNQLDKKISEISLNKEKNSHLKFKNQKFDSFKNQLFDFTKSEDIESILLNKELILKELFTYQEFKEKMTHGEIVSLDFIQKLLKDGILGNNTGIIQYYIAKNNPNSNKTGIFILNFITENRFETHSLKYSSPEEKERLEKLFFLLDLYYQTTELLDDTYGIGISIKANQIKGINSDELKQKCISLIEGSLKIFIEESDIINSFNNFDDFTGFLLNKLGQELCKFLYTPVQNSINLSNIKRILFVTSGLLHNFSFNLLKTEEMNLDKDYLVTTGGMEFFKMVSLSPFLSLKKKYPKKLFVNAFGVSSYYGNMKNLNSVTHELQVIKEHIFEKSILIKEQNVTPESILNAFRHSNVIHLSGHATVSDFSETSGYLYTSGKKNKLLSIEEITNTFPKSENISLLILSLCYGGLISNRKGDEVIGFTPAFFSLGVQSIIGNIIALKERTVITFFKNFYERVEQTINNEKSKLSLFTENLKEISKNEELSSHPYNWAFLEYYGLP